MHVYMIALAAGFLPILLGMINIFLAIIFLIITDCIWLLYIGRIEYCERKYEPLEASYILLNTFFIFLLTSIIRVLSISLLNWPLEKAAIFILSTGLIIAEGYSLVEFGYGTKNLLKQLIYGILLSNYIFVVFIGSLMMLYYISYSSFLNISINLEILLITLPFYLTVGLGEESLFRGYIERNAVISMGYRKGILWASILFGLWHIYWHIRPLNPVGMFIHVAFSFCFGILLGIIYEKTNSILVVTLIHATWDTFISALEYPVLGLQLEMTTIIIAFLLLFGVITLSKERFEKLL